MNRELMQRALDALIGARDSVSNELSNSIYHTASSRIIEQITDDLAKADASISELRDALAVGDTPSPGEPVAYATFNYDGDRTRLWWPHELDEARTYCEVDEEPEPLYTHAIPPGFVLVPVEPTQAMLDAADGGLRIARAYKAMIEAATKVTP